MKREGWGGVIAAIAILALAGCSTPELTDVTKETVKTVSVAVMTKCVSDKLGPEPQYLDSPGAVGAAGTTYDRVKLILAGRLQRIQRDKEKSAALAGCGGDPK